MTYSAILKTSVAAAGVAVMTSALPAQAGTERYDICQLDTVPQNVLRKILRRSDFDEILALMFKNCPESAFALTDGPTATITNQVPPLGDDDDDDEGPNMEYRDKKDDHDDDHKGRHKGGPKGGDRDGGKRDKNRDGGKRDKNRDGGHKGGACNSDQKGKPLGGKNEQIPN